MPVVYHFILDHRIGGPHVYVMSLLEVLSIKGSARIITTGKCPIADFSLINLRHRWMPLYFFEILINIALIIKCSRSGAIDSRQAIFHVHGAANLAPILSARLLRIPVIWHFHETGREFRPLISLGRRVLAGTRFRLVVVAKRAMEVFSLLHAEFAPGGVDRVFWNKSLTKSKNGRDLKELGALGGTEPLRLLLVGNLNPTKGLDIFLNALEGVERSLEVNVVGSELSTHQKHSEMLYQSAKNLLANNSNLKIEFLGWQEPAAVRELLANCDAFVLPSRSEACPLVLLEALAMGCLCVASDVGDVRLMLGGDARHRIFQPGAVEELRNILQTLESPPPPPRLNSLFVDEWNLERVAAKISAIYDELRKPPAKSM